MDLLGKSLALASAVLWAGAVILFKKAGDRISPLALNIYKTAVTLLTLLPVLLLLRVPLWPAPGVANGQWLAVAASGVVGIALADTLFFFALNLLGAGLAAIVDSTYTPLVMLSSWLMLAQTPRPEQIFGGLLVIAAVLVATLKKDHPQTGRKLLLGILVGATAMGMMAVSIGLMGPPLQKAPFLWVTFLRQLAALAAMALAVLFIPGRGRLFAPLFKSRESWRYALPGTLLGNTLAMTCWVAAFKFTSANSAAVLNQTSTVLIVILASIFLKEPFTRRRLLSALLAVAGSTIIMLG